MRCKACIPHGPEDPCTCDGVNCICSGAEIGCCCDVQWEGCNGDGTCPPEHNPGAINCKERHGPRQDNVECRSCPPLGSL
jgi:hypothetical protein